MIVKKIEIKDKNVKVLLDNDEYFMITLETYISNNILIDSEIDGERIEFLKRQDNYNFAKSTLLNKLSKKRLSSKEAIEFLIENNLAYEDALKIVKEFKNNYLINDLELAETVIEACLINKKGINIIKEKLLKRSIEVNYDDAINRFLDKERYEQNIKYQLDKYFRLGSKKSKVELRKYLVLKMQENGFLIEEFNKYLDEYEVDEYGSVTKEIDKFFKSKEINKENIAKITKKLLSKGFNYAIIKSVIRECECDETY